VSDEALDVEKLRAAAMTATGEPDIWEYPIKGLGSIVVRRMTSADSNWLKGELHAKPGQQHRIERDLVERIAVHPEKGALRALLDRRSMIQTTIMNDATKIAAEQDPTQGKAL
jgi:hypothetical protein